MTPVELKLLGFGLVAIVAVWTYFRMQLYNIWWEQRRLQATWVEQVEDDDE